jgi:hypothetical protein
MASFRGCGGSARLVTLALATRLIKKDRKPAYSMNAIEYFFLICGLPPRAFLKLRYPPAVKSYCHVQKNHLKPGKAQMS